MSAEPKPPSEISAELKQTYRRAIKLMHPDLATTEEERERRTRLMAQVNIAYERGDQEALEKLIKEYGEDPEVITGNDIASRIIKTIRRIAQLHRRLGELEKETEALKNSELFKLKQTIEQGEAKGESLLNDLIQQLKRDIVDRKIRLRAD